MRKGMYNLDYAQKRRARNRVRSKIARKARARNRR